jgi:UDPglucose 6-dehydrogenase
MNFERPKVGIIGLGFVGNAIMQSLDISCDLVLIDKDPLKGSHSYADLAECEGVFICVPTPFGNNGVCDTSILEEVLENLKGYDNVIISKCTAPPLFYKNLNKQYPNLVHSPEFLTAANASRDYMGGKFIILGGRVRAYLEQAEKISKWGQPNATDIAYSSIEEASLAKYTINSFLATKVSFMNEIYQLAIAIGADYNAVAKMVSLDNRIGHSHLRVPGPDGSFGFGGMCFPKDTAALLKYAEELDVPLNVLDAAVKKNLLLRLTEPK